MGWLRGGVSQHRGAAALVAFVVSVFMLLTGVLVVLPVGRAVADGLELGPDGYFNTLSAGATPVASSGWASTPRIVFGKQGSSGTYGGASVSGGYKTLAKGVVASVADANSFSVYGDYAYTKSATTSVAANEVLLWADDVVTAGFAFDANGTYRNSFDSATGPYKSNLASVSDAVGSANYSSFEQGLLRSAKLEGVCTAAQSSGCGSGSYTQQSDSVNEYKVFPLSVGDLNRFVGTTSGWMSADPDLACPSSTCANSVSGSWLRSAFWSDANVAFNVRHDGYPFISLTYFTGLGLRPALRLNLDNLLLSADSSNQSQSETGDLSLTVVEPGKKLNTWSASVSGGESSHTLNLSGNSDLGSELGWKIVDPVSKTVLGSGRTSADGNMDLPESAMSDDSKDYDLYVWGQQDGSATDGLTNKATEPVKTTIKGWKVKSPPSYGIELTGTTTGTLSAYKIGDYKDEVFDQTGALKSVMLTSPAALKDTLKEAAEIVGGSNVDADNPIGWVASQWLGYPTDPSSDDVTSAFSPYAGKLQLFAKELANKDDATLGGVKGSLTGLAGGPETLNVTGGPGLYLIVDSSGTSLPIIVGSKVFNEALDAEGRFVDFVDAGVKGKPRLGVAALKTSITDVAKRIVNDDGLDGFDVGSSVEYEIALQVPDLSGFSAVSYDSYVFNVADVAEAGLTLPAASEVKVLMDVPSPDTDVTGTSGLTIGVSGDTLSVNGLKTVFAEPSGSGVANKAAIPAGSLIRVRYQAVLNTGASFSAPGGGALNPNANTATLTRSKSDTGTETKTATANAYSFKLDLVKVDKDDTSKKLGGAKFEVSRDGQALKFTKLSDELYRLDAAGGTEVVAHTDGTLSLQGVEARELSFKETTAPSGYFKVSDFTVEVVPVWDVEATQVTVASYRTGGTNLAYVSQDGRSVVVADPAHSLTNLPYTGGIGILILLIVGALILVFAIRPYYLAKRAEATANLI